MDTNSGTVGFGALADIEGCRRVCYLLCSNHSSNYESVFVAVLLVDHL
jgi:hypothetical protein